MTTKPDPKKLAWADLQRAAAAGIPAAKIELARRLMGIRKPRKK